MPNVNVLNSTMHYRETGSGTPLVFLHGNPTSSHVWRLVLPRIGSPGRLLAPDLIGMGDSGKPAIDYSYDDQARYLDAWFDALDLDGVILVGHDWGGALGFDWASRHPERVRGVAFMETIVKPMVGDEFPEAARSYFAAIKTPGVGEEMILDRNAPDRSASAAGREATSRPGLIAGSDPASWPDRSRRSPAAGAPGGTARWRPAAPSSGAGG